MESSAASGAANVASDRGPDTCRCRRCGARKGDAERVLDAIRGDLAHGLYVDPAGGPTLFRDYAEPWRAGQVHRANTTARIETYLRRHAYPTLAGARLLHPL